MALGRRLRQATTDPGMLPHRGNHRSPASKCHGWRATTSTSYRSTENLCACRALTAPSFGQSSSLFCSPVPQRPMTLIQYSWTYQKPVDPRKPLHLHDIGRQLHDLQRIFLVCHAFEPQKRTRRENQRLVNQPSPRVPIFLGKMPSTLCIARYNFLDSEEANSQRADEDGRADKSRTGRTEREETSVRSRTRTH